MGVLLLFVVLLLLVFVFRYAQLRKNVRTLNRIVDEIRLGNLNQRFRIHAHDRSLHELSGSLNKLIDQLQQTVERERFLEEARRKMISNVSHDLRTPLTSLLGYIEALQQDGTLTAEERADYLDIVARKGKKMTELFQEFFELSKLESDDAVVQVQKVNMTEKVQEVIISFYHQFTGAGITPDLQIPERPLYVFGDPSLIERILSNLLSNALRYGHDGGVIGVTVREELDRVFVEVWDRGKGISAADLPHIFERLYTGEASRNATLQGTGLGLTITKKLVEKQRGEIFVTSTPGERTVFSFYLAKHV